MPVDSSRFVTNADHSCSQPAAIFPRRIRAFFAPIAAKPTNFFGAGESCARGLT